MKVLWFVNDMLPEFSAALGRKVGNTGGWMPSLIGAIRQYALQVELHVVCESDGDYMCEANGTHYYAFKTYNLGPRWRRATKASFGHKVKSLVAKIKPALIHFHGTENGYLDFPDDVFYTIPKIVTLQGIITGYYPHYMGGLTSRELRRYRNILRNILTGHDLEFAAYSWQCNISNREKRCLAKVEHIGGRTCWDSNWARVLAPQAQYHHIGEVLRPEFYEYKKGSSEVRKHSIVASAALKYPLKGGHWLLEAVAYLKRDYPDVTVRFVDAKNKIHPTGFVDKLRQTEYHRYIRSRIHELNLEDHVVFLPSLSADKVVDELSSAEVFCLPSLIENSPNSLAEAQLQRVPVVASYVGGIPSMVEDGKTGLLVPSGDAAALATAIARLFDDNGLKASLVENAWKVAIKRHDPQTVVGDLLNCYRKVVADA